MALGKPYPPASRFFEKSAGETAERTSSNCVAYPGQRGIRQKDHYEDKMKAKTWRQKIVAAAQAAGTYQPYFDSIIDTLADILEKRDELKDKLAHADGLIVEHTNKGGATNLEQHPALRAMNDLNRDALAYWRDLGLTPAGLKRINDQATVKPKVSALAEALKDLEG